MCLEADAFMREPTAPEEERWPHLPVTHSAPDLGSQQSRYCQFFLS